MPWINRKVLTYLRLESTNTICWCTLKLIDELRYDIEGQ